MHISPLFMATTSNALLRRPPPRVRPAAEFASSELSAAVLSLLAACGFSGSSANATLLFTELMQRYLQLLTRTSTDFAHQANRSALNMWDVCAALEGLMGAGAVEELTEWVSFEGVLKRDAATSRPEGIRAQLDNLGSYVACGRKRTEHPTAWYTELDTNPALAEAEAATAQCVDEKFVWGDATVAPSGSASLQPTFDGYVPDFLPPLPEITQPDDDMDVDEVPEIKPPQPESILPPSEPAPAPMTVAAVPEAQAQAVGRDGIRRVWRRRAQRYYGVLADAPSVRPELPMIEAVRAIRPTMAQQRSVRSSLRMFANELEELESDPASHVPVYLTSASAIRSNQTHIPASVLRDIAVKRRRLAHSFADPLRYVPNDSMHGGVNVHPASPSWTPGPSLLITIPHTKDTEDDGSADVPVFSAVHPHGRAVSMAPPSGALFPTLSYRHPAHLFTSLRIVAFPDIQRIVSRINDPPALLDDHRTEQVYHGITVSRDLLTGTMTSVLHRNTVGVMIDRMRGGNSYLHAALERLRFHLAAIHARRRAALDGGEQLEQMDREPIRGERIRLPRAGTLVHTWNWRDGDPRGELPQADTKAEDADKITPVDGAPDTAQPTTAPSETAQADKESAVPTEQHTNQGDSSLDGVRVNAQSDAAQPITN